MLKNRTLYFGDNLLPVNPYYKEAQAVEEEKQKGLWQ